jgi:hypothetical protein
MSRIKSFEDYAVKQHFGNGFTQWEKRYALVCVDDKHCTRALVRSAFVALEKYPEDFGQVFTRDDAKRMGLAY